jgi:hypothetical protein
MNPKQEWGTAPGTHDVVITRCRGREPQWKASSTLGRAKGTVKMFCKLIKYGARYDEESGEIVTEATWHGVAEIWVFDAQSGTWSEYDWKTEHIAKLTQAEEKKWGLKEMKS